MKCPNCGSEVFEGDKFCGECGFQLEKTDTINTEPAQESVQKEHLVTYVESDNTKSKTPLQPSETSVYFNDVINFIKRAVIRPDNIVGKGEVLKPSIPLGAFFGLVIIHALFLFLSIFTSLAKFGFGYGIGFPFGGFIGFIFVHVLIYAVFFLITYMLVKVLTRDGQNMTQVLVDFATTSIVVVSLFIVQMFLAFLGTLFGGAFGGLISGFGGIFAAIGSVLFVFAPIYIFLRHAEGRETRIDRFYSIIIYAAIALIVLSIFAVFLSTIIISLSVDSFMNAFELFDAF